MKKALYSIGLALFAVTISDVFAAAGSDPLILRTHFIGSEHLFADHSAAKLKEIGQLPASAGLRDHALGRFARLPFLALSNSLPAGAADQSALFRPLLQDLLARESFLEIRATPEFALAIRLPEERARVWQANLKQVVEGWKIGPVNELSGAVTGWEAKRKEAPAHLRVGRSGEWTIVIAGPETSALGRELLAKIKSAPRPEPGHAWLSGEANLARFHGWLPVLAEFDNLPIARFALTNRSDNVRTFVQFDFAKPHRWKTEPWRIPTNSIFDPLAAFVAARGLAPALEGLKAVQSAGYRPTPNQIIGWANRGQPLQFFYMAPSRGVTNELKRITPAVQRLVFPSGRTNLLGNILWDTNQHDIVWKGLPFAVPALGARHDSGTEYLSFELFPPIRTKTPAPADLYQQLVHNEKLVAYDWEITEYRIPHWRQFYQLAEIMTDRPLTETNAVSQQWIEQIAPHIGETVGELTMTSPTQMTWVRKSHVGLNAFELVTLARWLESTAFPRLGVFPPAKPLTRPARPPANQPNP